MKKCYYIFPKNKKKVFSHNFDSGYIQLAVGKKVECAIFHFRWFIATIRIFNLLLICKQRIEKAL